MNNTNYIKIIDGIRHCKPASRIVIVKNGFQYFNPTEEMLIEDGWVKEVTSIEEINHNTGIIGSIKHWLNF